MRSKSLQQLLWLASCIILTSVDLYYASRLMRYIVGDPTRMFRPVYSSPYTLFFRRFTSSKNDAWVTVFEKMNRILDTFWIVFKHCENTFWKKSWRLSYYLSCIFFFKCRIYILQAEFISFSSENTILCCLLLEMLMNDAWVSPTLTSSQTRYFDSPWIPSKWRTKLYNKFSPF